MSIIIQDYETEQLGLEVDNISDYQAAQSLIVNMVNLFKLIITSARVIVTDIIHLSEFLNTIMEIAAHKELAETVYKK